MVRISPIVNEVFPIKLRILIYLYIHGKLKYKDLESLVGTNYNSVKKLVNVLQSEKMVRIEKVNGISIVELTPQGKKYVKRIIKYVITPISLKELITSLIFSFLLLIFFVNLMLYYISFMNNLLYVIDISNIIVFIVILYVVVKQFTTKTI